MEPDVGKWAQANDDWFWFSLQSRSGVKPNRSKHKLLLKTVLMMMMEVMNYHDDDDDGGSGGGDCHNNRSAARGSQQWWDGDFKTILVVRSYSHILLHKYHFLPIHFSYCFTSMLNILTTSLSDDYRFRRTQIQGNFTSFLLQCHLRPAVLQFHSWSFLGKSIRIKMAWFILQWHFKHWWGSYCLSYELCLQTRSNDFQVKFVMRI